MRISIITPTLNNGNFIRECIESVRSQTIPVEHIVVDGGSKDSTIEILKEYRNIKWISEPDKGMYDAINKGLKMATGEIVGYLNSDDRYYSDTTYKVLTAFKRKPTTDFLYGACTYVDNAGKKKYIYTPLPYSNVLLRNMKGIPWAQSSCFWKAEVHRQIGCFNPALRYCGDYDFFSRLISNKLSGYRVKSPLSYFMLHENALSVKARAEMQEEFENICSRYGLKRNPFLGFIGQRYFNLINLDVYCVRIREHFRS
ncbi:MAG: glycosyltransferase family 2 protein [Nitrospirota bacterium]